eukprot:scaffold32570_cov47-Phaeocystis_antarctica.AAC.1
MVGEVVGARGASLGGPYGAVIVCPWSGHMFPSLSCLGLPVYTPTQVCQRPHRVLVLRAAHANTPTPPNALSRLAKRAAARLQWPLPQRLEPRLVSSGQALRPPVVRAGVRGRLDDREGRLRPDGCLDARAGAADAHGARRLQHPPLHAPPPRAQPEQPLSRERRAAP